MLRANNVLRVKSVFNSGSQSACSEAYSSVDCTAVKPELSSLSFAAVGPVLRTSTPPTVDTKRSTYPEEGAVSW